MELIDFSKLTEDFSLEEYIRDDDDGSYTKRILATLEDLIVSLNNAKSSDFEGIDFKPDHMKKALEAVRDAMPSIWERMHPADQWENM